MLDANLPYEKIAWLYTTQSIGQDLRNLFEAPQELPVELRRLVEQIERSAAPSDGDSQAPRGTSHASG